MYCTCMHVSATEIVTAGQIPLAVPPYYTAVQGRG